MIKKALFFYMVLKTVTALQSINDTQVKSPNVTSWNETWVDRLKHKLLSNYDTNARPSQHWNTTTVSVRLVLHTIEVDDTSNAMTANVWVMMTWTDEKLKWNKSEFNGLASINVGSREIWLPDIYLLNSAVHGMEYYGDRHCLVDNDGSVLWVTPTIFHAYCNLDFTYWPYDLNVCRLSLSSWTHDGTELDLKLMGNGIDLHDYVPINEWVIHNANGTRREETLDCCPEPYVTLDFELELIRSYQLYSHIVLVPIIPIIVLALITFWLRPRSEIKLVVNAFVFLIVVLYLIYFGYKVPPREGVPLIVRFYCGCLYQTAFSLLISILVINIDKLSSYMTIPRLLRRLLLGRVGRFLGLGDMIREIEYHRIALEQEMCESHLVDISMTTSFVNLDNNNPNSLITPTSLSKVITLEWILLGAAIDRIMFILFIFIFIVMGFRFIPTRKYSYSTENLPYWHKVDHSVPGW